MSTAATTVRALHPSEPTEVPGSPNWFLTLTPRPLLLRSAKRGKHGAEDGTGYTPVLDWLPEVTERLVVTGPDGTVASVHYRVRVGADERTVSAEDLRTGQVWDTYADAVGTGTRMVRDVLGNVVRYLGTMCERITATPVTGWHRVNGERVYLRPDGRTVPEGRPLRLVGMRAVTAAAAAPHPDAAPAEALAPALGEMAGHGWAPLLGLGIGARALGHSIRDVSTSVIAVGPPNSGKTSLAGAARSLVLTPAGERAWPPVATSSFSDTITDIECRIDAEADMAPLLEDLALTRDSSRREVAKGDQVLEGIVRPLWNGTQVRGRRGKGLDAQAERYVRAPLVVTAQSLPPTMQTSLYRRTVLVYMGHGDTDTAWWRDNGARMSGAQRAIGDRILERLAAPDAAEVLRAADEAGTRALSAALDTAAPDWRDDVNGLDGVAERAGALLGGLVLVAEAAGAEAGPLLDAVAPRLAASLAQQAEAMADRAEASDDVGASIGDVLRMAMASGRAHVRDAGDRPARVPGRAAAEVGIAEAPGADPVGRGLPVYWLPDRGAVGATSSALHTILSASGDVRVQGYTVRSLPGALLRAGAALPSQQASQGPRAATTRVPIRGAGSPPMVLLRQELVWPDLASGEGGGAEAPAAPEPSGPPDAPQAPQAPREPQAPPRKRPEAPQSAPQAPERERPAAERPTRRRAGRERARALGLDSDGCLWTDEGMQVDPGRLRTVVDLCTRALDLMPEGGTVALTAAAAVALGYPAAPRPTPEKATKADPEPRAVTEAAARGWQHSRDGVLAYTTWWQAEGRRPAVTLVVPEWMEESQQHTNTAGNTLLGPGDDVMRAAYLLGRMRQVCGGVPWTMTAGLTGVSMIRRHWMTATGAYRTDPRAPRGQAPKLKYNEDERTERASILLPHEAEAWWTRELSQAEAAPGMWAHTWDVRLAYCAALGSAVLPRDAINYQGEIMLGDLFKRAGAEIARAGFVEIANKPYRIGDGPNLAGPPPRGQEEARTRIVDVVTAGLLLKLGFLEGMARVPFWGCDDPKAFGRLLRPVADQMRDAALAVPEDTDDPEEARIVQAAKGLYREGVGMLRRGGSFVRRPDWQSTVVATNRTNLFRKMLAVHEKTGLMPVEINLDGLVYISSSPDPIAPEGMTMAVPDDPKKIAGRFAHKGAVPVDEYLAARDEQRRKAEEKQRKWEKFGFGKAGE